MKNYKLLYFLPLTFEQSEVFDLKMLGHAITENRPVTCRYYDFKTEEAVAKVIKNPHIERLSFESDGGFKQLHTKLWGNESVWTIEFLLTSQELQSYHAFQTLRLIAYHGINFHHQRRLLQQCQNARSIKVCLRDIANKAADACWVFEEGDIPEPLTDSSKLTRQTMAL